MAYSKPNEDESNLSQVGKRKSQSQKNFFKKTLIPTVKSSQILKLVTVFIIRFFRNVKEYISVKTNMYRIIYLDHLTYLTYHVLVTQVITIYIKDPVIQTFICTIQHVHRASQTCIFCDYVQLYLHKKNMSYKLRHIF